MTKRLPEYLKGPAHYRRTVRNVRPPRMTLVGADDPDRGRTDEAPRRSITLPRVQFLERPDPDSAAKPRLHVIEEAIDPSAGTS
jgi:hypothetical protein